jgi:spore coat polysaccharide biosynthesis predicted glycosyltransferase SpsG/GNAT superfamily N-acetyltransferase
MLILLRCDGGGRLGVGHVIRSLALAEEAVAAGHDVVVAGHFEGSFLAGQLAAAPVEVAALVAPLSAGDQRDLIDLVGRLRPDVLHVDSYEAPVGLGELVAPVVRSMPLRSMPLGSMVLSNMEDGTFGRRPADVVVDPTLGAELSARPDDGSPWLLRGSRYMPVRRRVIGARRRVAGDPVGGTGDLADVELGQAARSVLVVMGGTDPVGLTPSVVELLARTGLALEVTAIAVGENAERVRAAVAGSRLSLNVLAPVDDLAAMMAGQDLVITAAGTSVWELCCLGVPMAVVWAVDNQREGYERVVAAGAGVGLGGPELGGPELGGPVVGGDELGGDELGWPVLGGDELGGPEGGAAQRAVGLLSRVLTHSRVRAGLAAEARGIVDGLGAWRVVRMWEQAGRQPLPQSSADGRPIRLPTVGAAGLTARPATLEDSRQLWEWRNDPATRAGSRSSAEVPWDDHLRWLTASLTRADRMLLVVEEPAGTPGAAGVVDPAGTPGAAGLVDPAGSVHPVGTVRWDLTGEREWEVSVTVAPDRRGRSLARALLRAGEAALSEATRASGTDVTSYLAVVHIDNRVSVRLFETSAYVPDLPPDPRGFMRFRKTARVA